ncbi:MAG: dCTP deaminase [Methanobacteriota archaeon]
MTLLSDAEIKRWMTDGSLRIAPFAEKNLTPNGYDLTIEEVLIPGQAKAFDVTVPPMSRFVVSTRERVELNGPFTAQLWIRTTWARRGVLASFGRIDAGFKGTLTLAAFNASAEPLPVRAGETFAQLVFEPLAGGVEKTYAERSGNYQDQKGVTLAKDKSRVV